jgi:hypothetical protein
MTSRRTNRRSGILSIALERAERGRLDFVASGVMTIQGQKERLGVEPRR